MTDRKFKTLRKRGLGGKHRCKDGSRTNVSEVFAFLCDASPILNQDKPKGYVPYPQKMTIPEIIRECKRLGITYGEFQARRLTDDRKRNA